MVLLAVQGVLHGHFKRSGVGAPHSSSHRSSQWQALPRALQSSDDAGGQGPAQGVERDILSSLLTATKTRTLVQNLEEVDFLRTVVKQMHFATRFLNYFIPYIVLEISSSTFMFGFNGTNLPSEPKSSDISRQCFKLGLKTWLFDHAYS